MSRSIRMSTCLLAAAIAWRSAGSQAVQSGVRSITLIAYKAPAVPALQAVSVHGGPIASVDVRDTGFCRIAIEREPAAVGRPLRIRDASGAETAFDASRPVSLFAGQCRESEPEHCFTLVDPGSGGEAADSVAVLVSVVSGRGDRVRRWTSRLVLPLH